MRARSRGRERRRRLLYKTCGAAAEAQGWPGEPGDFAKSYFISAGAVETMRRLSRRGLGNAGVVRCGGGGRREKGSRLKIAPN
jgi:hypothetical protein